jgi:site-specific recombinase XerC
MVRNSAISLIPQPFNAHSGVRTWEVDGAIVISVNLVDHVLQLRFGGILAKGSHNGAELLGGNLPCKCLSALFSAKHHLHSNANALFILQLPRSWSARHVQGQVEQWVNIGIDEMVRRLENNEGASMY